MPAGVRQCGLKVNAKGVVLPLSDRKEHCPCLLKLPSTGCTKAAVIRDQNRAHRSTGERVALDQGLAATGQQEPLAGIHRHGAVADRDVGIPGDVVHHVVRAECRRRFRERKQPVLDFPSRTFSETATSEFEAPRSRRK